MKALFIIIPVFLFSTCLLYAQQYEDVVYLKNGSIIRGIIIEQVPNTSLKIKTKDGSIFVYKTEEIDKMTKEKIADAEEDETPTSKKPVKVNSFLGFYAGLNFANGTSDPKQTKSGPEAITAFLVGAMYEVNFNKNFASQLAIHYIQKGADKIDYHSVYPVKFTFSYLDIQAVIKGKMPSGGFTPYALFAPTIGIKLSATGEYQGHSGDVTEASDINFGIDFGAGTEFPLSKKTEMFVEGRYEWGISNINSNTAGTGNTSVFTNGIKLMAGIKFGM